MHIAQYLIVNVRNEYLRLLEPVHFVLVNYVINGIVARKFIVTEYLVLDERDGLLSVESRHKHLSERYIDIIQYNLDFLILNFLAEFSQRVDDYRFEFFITLIVRRIEIVAGGSYRIKAVDYYLLLVCRALEYFHGITAQMQNIHLFFSSLS